MEGKVGGRKPAQARRGGPARHIFLPQSETPLGSLERAVTNPSRSKGRQSPSQPRHPVKPDPPTRPTPRPPTTAPPKVVRRRLAVNEPIVIAGGFMYEEGGDLSDSEVELNARHLGTPMAALPGGGLAHAVVASIEDQSQQFKVEVIITHRVRGGLTGGVPPAGGAWGRFRGLGWGGAARGRAGRVGRCPIANAAAAGAHC
jgi:hypothetical protein